MKRVLVVDDASTVRLYHRQILESAGFAVAEAANGLEALEKALPTQGGAAESLFALWLIDINMPRMDGITLLQQLRQDPAIGATPAVMITTEDRRGEAELAYAAGANLFLVKPLAPDELLAYARLLTEAPTLAT